MTGELFILAAGAGHGMATLLVILAAASIGLGLATWLRLPVVPLMILTGIGVKVLDVWLVGMGWDVFGGIADQDMLQEVLLLGLTFLVFAAGMELNPSRVGQQRRATILIGIAQFFVMMIIGMGSAMLFGLSPLAALYMGLAVSASSTIVVVRMLQQRRQFFEPFGRLVLGVLLLQDLMIIILIAAISGGGGGVSGVVLMTLATLGLVLLTWVFIRWVAPWLIIRQKLDQEELMLVALAILFGFVGLAYWMDVPLVVGAFFAGVALSSFPVNGIARGQLISLNTFFLAIFFVSLGAILVMPTAAEFALIAALTVLIILVTPLLVVLTANWLGVTTRTAVESGLLLAQSSEFSIVIIMLGVGAGVLEPSMLSVIALVTIITMTLTTFIATDRVTWMLVRLHPSARTELDDHDLKEHIIMLGCGSNSQVLLDLLLLQRQRVVVVDEDPNTVERLRSRGIDVVRGDGADPSVLDSVDARQASVIISTIRRVEDNERMLAHVGKDVTVMVRVFSEVEAKRIERMGGVAIREAEAAADDFLEWFQTQSA